MKMNQNGLRYTARNSTMTTEIPCDCRCEEINNTLVLITEGDCPEYENVSCSWDDFHIHPTPTGGTPYEAVMTAVVMMLGLAIVFMNMVCLRAVYRHDLCKKDYKFVFITNLAIADLILGVTISLFRTLEYWVSQSTVKTTLCVLTNICCEATLGATTLNLVAIAIERYLKIVWPLKHVNLVTGRRVSRGIVAIWIMAVIHGFVHLIGIDLDVIEESNCSFLHMVACPVLLYGFLCQYVMPITLIAVLHGHIVKIAVRHRRQIHCQEKVVNETKLSGSAQMTNFHWKGIVTMIIVVGVMSLCWAPYNALLLMKIIEPDIFQQSWTIYVADVTYCIYYSNSLMNPLIWARWIPEIRRDLSSICVWKKVGNTY